MAPFLTLLPLSQWILIQLITSLTVAFTPAQSWLRTPATALTALLAYLVQVTIRQCFSETRFAGPVVATCWVNVLNAVDLLVLSRVSYERQHEWEHRNNPIKATSDKAKTNLKKKITWSLGIPYNYRRINTPWQIPHMPACNSKNPDYTPPKTTFLLHCVVKLAFSITIIQILTIDADPNDTNLAHAIAQLPLSPSTALAPFSPAMPARRVLVQVLSTVSFGIITRAAIGGMYAAAAIGSVLLGLSEPASWPPVFGGFGDGWSLRGFWGQTWHQTLRKLLVSSADFCSSILGLYGQSAQIFRFVFAFLVSGAIHSLMDVAFGVPPGKSGGMWFFGLQVGGLVIEKIARDGLRSAGGGKPLIKSEKVSKGIGYLWVLGFLAWVTPVWTNPILVGLWADGQRIPSPFLGLSSWRI